MTQHVLIIEDDDLSATLVESQLVRHGEGSFKVVRTTTLREAIGNLHSSHIDVILLDLDLPDSHGLASITRLKEAAPDVPIVVLTANEDEHLPVQAIMSGAQEYLSKDLVVGKLLIRSIELSVARQKQLARAQAEAHTDPLTGLANRRALELELKRRHIEFERFKQPYCVAMFDIDHFKKINDTWGHDIGDTALNHVSQTLRSLTRKGDTVARYGGEEFGLVLTHCNLQEATRVVERMRAAIAASKCETPQQALNLTVSAGLAERGTSAEQNVMIEADQALYLAKAAGRNCVRTAADL